MRILYSVLAAAFLVASCAVAPTASGDLVTAIEARLITTAEYGHFKADLQNPFHAFESIVNKPKIYFIPIVLSGSIAMADVVTLEAVSVERGEASEAAKIWLRDDLTGYWADHDVGDKPNQRIKKIISDNVPISMALKAGRSSVRDIVVAVISTDGGKPETWRAVVSVNGEPLEFSGAIDAEAPFLEPPRMF